MQYIDPITGKVGNIGNQNAATVASDTLAAQNRAQRIANSTQSNQQNIVNLGNVDPNAVGGTGASRVAGIIPANDNLDAALQSLIDQNKSDAERAVDTNKIRTETLNQFSGQISAIENIYKDILNSRLKTEEVSATDRAGQLRAAQNASGSLGSGRGARQGADLSRYNEGERGRIMQEVEAEKIDRINALMNQARQSSEAEIARQTEAKRLGGENYINYLTTQDSRRQQSVQNIIANMVSQGIDYNELTPDEIQELSTSLKVSPADLQRLYNSNETVTQGRKATAETSRQGAIAGLIRQGITDPLQILDQINYDESGNLVGDVTLAEINDVIKGTTRTPVELSEGQALYDPVTGKLIVKNSKTYKATGSGGGSSSGASTGSSSTGKISYEEFVKSPTGIKALNDAQNAANQSFTPAKRDQVLRAAYDKIPAQTQSTATIVKMTPTQKNDVSQAGLASANQASQSYFLSAPKAFRDIYKQGVAAGLIPANASVSDIQILQAEWDKQQKAAKKTSGSSTGSSTATPSGRSRQ